MIHIILPVTKHLSCLTLIYTFHGQKIEISLQRGLYAVSGLLLSEMD